MSEVKWIKITTSMFDDEKIKIIESMPEADSILVIWIKLLTLSGKVNSNGYIFLTENIPYTDEMLSNLFNRPLNTVRLALSTFKHFGMIDYNEADFLHITNWGKHQNVEGLDKIKEQNRLRQQRFKDKQKELPEPPKVTLPVTLSNATDIELDIDKKKNKEYTPEFIKWYSEFPLSQAKADSFKNFEKVRKGKGLDYILTTTKNYLNFLERNPDKKKYPYSSNNFFGTKQYCQDYETAEKESSESHEEQQKRLKYELFGDKEVT